MKSKKMPLLFVGWDVRGVELRQEPEQTLWPLAVFAQRT